MANIMMVKRTVPIDIERRLNKRTVIASLQALLTLPAATLSFTC